MSSRSLSTASLSTTHPAPATTCTHPSEGDDFDAFRKSCANFVGFRKIDDLPFAKNLKRLADRYKPPSSVGGVEKFVKQLCELLPDETEPRRRSQPGPSQETPSGVPTLGAIPS